MSIREYKNLDDLLLDIHGIKRAIQVTEQNKIRIEETKTPESIACCFFDVNTKQLQENTIPGNLGECADMLMNIKKDRKQLSRQDDELKSYEGVLKDHILECFKTQGLTSSSGLHGCVTIGITDRFSVFDKEVFLKYIIEKKGYDLIGQSVSAPAMKCRVMDGVEVPGVKSFEQTLIKLTKRKI